MFPAVTIAETMANIISPITSSMTAALKLFGLREFLSAKL
jgi:hypothetical protein